jgi:GxxExxY protein
MPQLRYIKRWDPDCWSQFTKPVSATNFSCEAPLSKGNSDLPICYEGIRLESGLRIDLLVDNCIVLELKTVEKILPVHEAQLLSYLKLTNCRIGFLLNFNVPLMKDGIRRFAR